MLSSVGPRAGSAGPGSPGCLGALPEQQGSLASLSGKVQAALIETGPPPCPETGQHGRAAVLQDRLLFPSESWWCGVSQQDRVLSGRGQAGLSFPGHI